MENWKDVVDVIEATFGTSLSSLFIQWTAKNCTGECMAKASANKEEFKKISNVQKGAEHTAKGFLMF